MSSLGQHTDRIRLGVSRSLVTRVATHTQDYLEHSALPVTQAWPICGDSLALKVNIPFTKSRRNGAGEMFKCHAHERLPVSSEKVDASSHPDPSALTIPCQCS